MHGYGVLTGHASESPMVENDWNVALTRTNKLTLNLAAVTTVHSRWEQDILLTKLRDTYQSYLQFYPL